MVPDAPFYRPVPVSLDKIHAFYEATITLFKEYPVEDEKLISMRGVALDCIHRGHFNSAVSMSTEMGVPHDQMRALQLLLE